MVDLGNVSMEGLGSQRIDLPNILVIVWDACRYDAAKEHAPTLKSIAEDNLWFDKAIAPAPWTLPSHMSIFSGTYPHDHRIYQPGQSPSTYPLLEVLQHHSTYGISGNPFFSHKTNAHEFFDKFFYTMPTLFADGLNVIEFHDVFDRSSKHDEGSTRREIVSELFRRINTHDHPMKSLANVLSVTLLSKARKSNTLNRIPHRLFNKHDMFAYSPERNTRHIERIIQSEASQDGPFFIFANYMDTHRPYAPPSRFQRRHLGRELSYREINRIDKTLADPWTYLIRLQRGDISDDEIETLRKLYAGSVNLADAHLRRILQTIKDAGMYEETLVIVTSDHGECLGELDEMGRRRVGHQMTVSDNVLHVPLVIAHPDLEPRRVEERVSIKNIFKLITRIHTNCLNSDMIAETMMPSNDIVVSEYPPKNVTDIYEDHPEVPREVIREEASSFSSIAYLRDWKLVITSDGDAWAWQAKEERLPESAPADLRDVCERHLECLMNGEDRSQLDQNSLNQLKDLGYL